MKRGQENWLVFQGLRSPGSGMNVEEVVRGCMDEQGVLKKEMERICVM